MIELEFLGRSGDAHSVIFTDSQGERYTVAITDELRGALRRDLAYYEGTKKTGTNSTSLRPRHIQAMLREGQAASEIAEKQGLELEAVTKYEAPIVAEKAWAISQAQQAPLNPDSGSPVLEDLVINRLAARGVDHQSLSWSALRRPGENWEVSLTFIQGAVERSATWTLSSDGSKINAVDQEAQWLTETASPLAPVSAFFPPVGADAPEPDQKLQEDLLDRANAMRGQRAIQTDESNFEEESSFEENDSQPFFSARVISFETESTDKEEVTKPFPLQVVSDSTLPEPLKLPQSSTSKERVDPITGSLLLPATTHPTSLDSRNNEENVRQLAKSSAADSSSVNRPNMTGLDTNDANENDKKRTKRRSVPSWDEIVFGTRHD